MSTDSGEMSYKYLEDAARRIRQIHPNPFGVGKLMPNAVKFSEFSPIYEDFRGPNYVDVHNPEKIFFERSLKSAGPNSRSSG